MEYKDYQEYLKSDEWKAKRDHKIRSSKTCAFCGSANNLQVHHLTYRNGWGKESKKDLRVVCKRCHTCIHELFRDGLLKYDDTNKLGNKNLHNITKKQLLMRYGIRFVSKEQCNRDEIELHKLLKQEKQDYRNAYDRYK